MTWAETPLRTVLGTLLVALTAACATQWKLIEPGTTIEQAGFAFEAPAGWSHDFARVDGEHLLSCDGPGLQVIKLHRIEAGEELSTGRALDLALTTAELTGELVAAWVVDLWPAELEVLDARPARLDGSEGFRLHVGWTRPMGLRVERVAYGAVRGDELVLARFEAPSLHYFQRDLPVFEALVADLRLE